MKVLIIPDKFKGTLTADAAADAIARGWRRARPADAVTLLPMSDGGDGFGEIISRVLHAKRRVTRTVDAARRPIAATWWWEPKSKTAVIESARVVGLAMLPPSQFHPFQLDTFGLGKVVQEASRLGAKRCVVGLGGSATNDGGFGLARALGWKFLDAAGAMIERWTRLHALVELRPPRRRNWIEKLRVAVDVQNPLLGRRGATRVFGPQKGLAHRDLAQAEECLRRLAIVVRRQFGSRAAEIPGAGAAGGLGFAFLALVGGQIEPGFACFARHADLAGKLRSADLVITGEGMLDHSTLMGKGAGELARRCRKLGTPCLALAGRVAPGLRLGRGFTGAHALTQLASLKTAQTEPAVWLERLAATAASQWGDPPL